MAATPSVLPLMEVAGGGSFVLNEQSVEEPLGFSEALAVLAIRLAVTGPHRNMGNGKFFLIRGEISDHAATFTVGHSVKSCTKGIWMHT